MCRCNGRPQRAIGLLWFMIVSRGKRVRTTSAAEAPTVYESRRRGFGDRASFLQMPNSIDVPIGISNAPEISEDEWRTQYDFVVKISSVKDGYVSVCTGVVYATVVVTSAHCIHQKYTSYRIETGHLQTISSSLGVRHPKYSNNYVKKHGVDVAVLFLSDGHRHVNAADIRFSSTRGPWTSVEPRAWPRFAGMGLTQAFPKRFSDRPVVSSSLLPIPCEEPLDGQMCFAPDGCLRETLCGGDSGGPLFYLTGGGDSGNAQHKLHEVIIRGLFSAYYPGSLPCGNPGLKSIVTSVSTESTMKFLKKYAPELMWA